jgi:hypothetical protein
MGPGSGKYPISAISNVIVTHSASGIHTLTGADGKFTLNNLPAGNGALIFQKAGFKEHQVGVNVQANTTTTLASNINLEADPIGGKKLWTLFVYIAADNSLADNSTENLNELEQLGSTDFVNIVAFVDKTGENSKLYYIQKDDDTANVTSPYYDFGSNLDSGDVNIFEQISTQIMKDYPAEHFLLDLWNHGSGIDRNKNQNGVYGSRNICEDDTSNSQLTEVQVSTVLPELTSLHGRNLDIIACDACLMADMEVAYQWKDYCDYFVASENSVPADGFPYDTAFKQAVDNPNIAAIDFAKSIVTAFGEYYTANGVGYETLSVINMSMVGNLNTLVDNYSKSLIANGNATNIWINAYRRSIFFGQEDLRDLYSFAFLEKNECNKGIRGSKGYANEDAQEVMNIISPIGDSKVIVANYYGKLFEEYFKMGPGGISIWGWYFGTIPDDSPYKLCEFYSDNNWPNLINFLNANH